MNKLFCLHVSEDGDVSLFEIPDFDRWMKSEFEGCTPPVFLSEVPRDLMNGTGGKYILIKGEVVVPRPVQVVTKFEI